MTDGDTKKIKVKTTLPARPFILNSERVGFRTERLLVRPFSQNDLTGLHRLRSDPEVMFWTATGQITKDLNATRNNLNLFIPPNDATSFNFVICLRETSEMIGAGSVHDGAFEQGRHGWPAIGYMIVHETWGQGYATEFVKGFLPHWWSLPRIEVVIDVDPFSVERHISDSDEGHLVTVPEQLTALVLMNNAKSVNVLRKCGFVLFREETEPDNRGQVELKGLPVTLGGLTIARPTIP